MPVLVWIYGGGLRIGNGADVTYDGTRLAQRGVVLVTINYRLGAFGYLAHPLLSAESEHAASGNYGTLDQVAALGWIQRNIAAFGGDPSRVAIFGESAGSWSVNHLMATPLARGLFHAAIGESGGGFGSRGRAEPKAEIEAAGERFVEALLGDGVAPSPEALRAASADEVQAVAPDLVLSTANVDGWVFPDTVYNIFAAGEQHDVPVIVGSNADEMSILGGAAGAETLEQHRESIRNEYGEHADAFFETFPAETDEEAQQARMASGTDATFGWEMRTWARMMETVSSPAYLYFFSRIPARARTPTATAPTTRPRSPTCSTTSGSAPTRTPTGTTPIRTGGSPTSWPRIGSTWPLPATRTRPGCRNGRPMTRRTTRRCTSATRLPWSRASARTASTSSTATTRAQRGGKD